MQTNKEKLKLKNGLHYKKVKKKEKIILSGNFSKELVRKIHNIFCHTGIKQIENEIKPHYPAKKLTKNIRKICKDCKINKS